MLNIVALWMHCTLCTMHYAFSTLYIYIYTVHTKEKKVDEVDG